MQARIGTFPPGWLRRALQQSEIALHLGEEAERPNCDASLGGPLALPAPDDGAGGGEEDHASEDGVDDAHMEAALFEDEG